MNDACRYCGKELAEGEAVQVGDGLACRTCLYDRMNRREEVAEDPVPKDSGEDKANAAFTLVVGLPIMIGVLGGPPFFLGFLGMIHEMGHFVVMLLDVFLLPGDNTILILLAGGGTEILVPFLSAVLAFKNPRLATTAFVFVAAAGAAFVDTGNYMSSAQSPYGYAYISGQPMTEQNHDYSRIFSHYGVLDRTREISSLFLGVGWFLQLMGLFSAALTYTFLHNERLKTVMYAAVPAALSLVYVGQGAAALAAAFTAFAVFFAERIEDF